MDVDSAHTSSSEPSPIVLGGEGAGVGIGNGDESGGGVPPVPPLPNSVSVSRSISVSTESASTSWHDLNLDPRVVSMSSPPSPPSTSSPSIASSSSSSSSTHAHTHTGAYLPPGVSLALTSSALTCQPIPPGQRPLLPSQILVLGSEVGVVYGSSGYGGSGTMTELTPAPLQLISRPSILEGNGMPPSTDVGATADIDSASSGMGVGLGAKMYDDVYAEGDEAEVHGDDDDDVDRFMDQFMDHYNHPDREEDDEGKSDLQGQEVAGEEEEDGWVGKVDKSWVMNEDEMRIPPPTQPQPPATPPKAIPVSDPRTMSDITTSATFTSAFPDSITIDTSSAILAPTLRTRTRTTTGTGVPAATTTTTSVNTVDNEADDASLFGSYLYTYLYHHPPSSRHDLERSPTPSVFPSSATTPPVSATRGSRWSPSAESVSVSRSRSLSSTYTSLSFELESESSSSLGGDDDDDQAHHISGGRYNSHSQHQPPPPPPPPPRINSPPIMLIKSTEETLDTLSHSEVSVLGSPPLSMPFSGNEGMGYSPVPVPSPGSIRPIHHHDPISSKTDHKEMHDNTKSNVSTAGIMTTYFNDVNIDNMAGEAAGEDFNLRRRSRQNVVSKLWVAGGVSAVVMAQSERKDGGKGVDNDGMESEVVSQERREEDIMGKKVDELAAEVKTQVKEDVEVGHEVEWEYVVGPGPFVGGSNGSSSHVRGLDVAVLGQEQEGGRQQAEETTAIPIVTPHGFSEPVINDINLVATRQSPPLSTTSLTTPTMTQFMSTPDVLLKNDVTNGSSTAVAAALAMSTWKQGTSEMVEGVEGLRASKGGDGNGGNGLSSSTYNNSSGAAYRAATHDVPSNLNSTPFDWKRHNGRRGGGDDDDDDDDAEKRRRLRAALERGGRRDHLSFLAISSGSSSSSGDDDDHYGPASPSSSSQPVMDVNLRTRPSRTHSNSAAPSPGYLSSRFPVASGSTGSSTGGSRFSDDDEGEDDHVDGRQQASQAHNNGDDDDDDDDNVPLAKRIPSALTAQKSIRHQVRQEREQKKREKVLRGQAEAARTRLMTLRSAGTVPSSSSYDAALLSPSAAPSSSMHHQHLEQQQQQRRQRTQTLTGNGSISGNPFSAEDLAKKLRDINGRDGGGAEASSPIGATALYQQQQAHLRVRHRSKSMSRSSWDIHPALAVEALPPPPAPIPHMGSAISHAQRTKSMKEPSSSYRYHPPPSPSPVAPSHGPPSTATLRPMRSFHRSSADRRPIGMDDSRSVPLPLDAEQRVSRSSTSITRSTRDGPSTSTTPISTPHRRSFSQSRSSVDRASPMTNPEPPVPPIPTAARISHDEHRKLLKPHKESPSSRVGSSTRTSVDTQRTSSHQHRPVVPVPALPSTSSAVDPLPMPMMSGSSKPAVVVQQRVFISDMQRFNMVEIGTSTTAGDVIEMIEAEGSLVGFAGSGGWMVFEIAQDFGMGASIFFSPSRSLVYLISGFFPERPIRSFELVADVQASWNKDKMVNYLLLRLTPLAVPLNRSVCFLSVYSFFPLSSHSYFCFEGYPF